MPRPEAKRLRKAYLVAIATSACLVINNAMIILSVAPLLPTPDRNSNLRLGIILALACSATFSSTLLMATEIINFRNHFRNFLCVPNSEAHLIHLRPSTDAMPASGVTTGNSSRVEHENAAAASPSQPRPSDTIQPTVSGTGTVEVQTKGAEKSFDASTQTTDRPGRHEQ